MTKPQQRVILYRNGLRRKTPGQYANEYRLQQEGYVECPKCGRAVREKNGGYVKHFADFPNRIRCILGTEKPRETNGHEPGKKRGPYRPRQGKRVIDKDRKPVDSLYRNVVG